MKGIILLFLLVAQCGILVCAFNAGMGLKVKIRRARTLAAPSNAVVNKPYPRLRLRASDELIPVPTGSLTSVEAFDLATNNPLTDVSLQAWQDSLDGLVGEFRSLQDSGSLLSVYKSLLTQCAPLELDPLQMATFDVLTGAIVDSLVRLNGAQAVTELIDRVTDVHLDYVDTFADIIDDGGSDGYSQSSRQEFLAYQFGGLVRRCYAKISRTLGQDFDSSRETRDMRTNSWVSAVYARLQRRFVRFLSNSCEETCQEQDSASFERFISKLDTDVFPRYLAPTQTTATGLPENLENKENKENKKYEYPAWRLAAFYIKLLRNIASSVDEEVLLGFESSVVRHFQSELGDQMKKAGRRLSKQTFPYIPSTATTATTTTTDSNKAGAGDRERAEEELLDIGHSCAAAVYSVWHIRHNLLGTPVIGNDGQPTGEVQKDFLRPVGYSSLERAQGCVPKVVLKDSLSDVQTLSEFHSPDAHLEGAALVAHSIRSTASEDFRALITYNSDSSDWQGNRDDTYMRILSSTLQNAIAGTVDVAGRSVVASTFSNSEIREEDDIFIDGSAAQGRFLENLLALAALEETVGVREPRAATAEAYEMAVSAAVTDAVQREMPRSDFGKKLKLRISYIERSLGMLGRLSDNLPKVCRQRAFKRTVDSLMEKGAGAGGFGSGLKRVDAVYRDIALAMSITEAQAEAYVRPMGQAKFDSAVGKILMNADLVGGVQAAEAVKRNGDMFRQQILGLANDLLLTDQEALERVKLLAGAVFESLVEAALEEYRKLSYDTADLALKRAKALTKHPLLVALGLSDTISTLNTINISTLNTNEPESPNEKSEEGADAVCVLGCQMVVARLGLPLSAEAMRMLEGLRQRQTGSGAGGGKSGDGGGWGESSVRGDEKYASFLGSLQQNLMLEYSRVSTRDAAR